jgi:hypothetical protein
VQVDFFLSLAACYREGPLGLSKSKIAISTALTRLKILLTPKKKEILDVIAG